MRRAQETIVAVESSKYYIFLCVCGCASAFVGGCVVEYVCVCVGERVALIIQHTTRHHIVICGLSGPPKFSTLSHKQHDFRKKII